MGSLEVQDHHANTISIWLDVSPGMETASPYCVLTGPFLCVNQSYENTSPKGLGSHSHDLI